MREPPHRSQGNGRVKAQMACSISSTVAKTWDVAPRTDATSSPFSNVSLFTGVDETTLVRGSSNGMTTASMYDRDVDSPLGGQTNIRGITQRGRKEFKVKREGVRGGRNNLRWDDREGGTLSDLVWVRTKKL